MLNISSFYLLVIANHTPPNYRPRYNSHSNNDTTYNNCQCKQIVHCKNFAFIITLKTFQHISALTFNTRLGTLTFLASFNQTAQTIVGISIVTRLTLNAGTPGKPRLTLRTHWWVRSIACLTTRRNLHTRIVPTGIVLRTVATSWVYHFEGSCAFLTVGGRQRDCSWALLARG